jgi:hypothetical protein
MKNVIFLSIYRVLGYNSKQLAKRAYILAEEADIK